MMRVNPQHPLIELRPLSELLGIKPAFSIPAEKGP